VRKYITLEDVGVRDEQGARRCDDTTTQRTETHAFGRRSLVNGLLKLVETGKLTWPSPSLGLVLTVTPVCKVAS
jgi:hypothetical protein